MTLLDQIHGALASASITLGITAGVIAILLTVVYFGFTGRWPWQ